MFTSNPVAGVGVGSQPLASRGEEGGKRETERNASHTTPLTILADFGVLGFALYVWLLAAAAWSFVLVWRRDPPLGVGLAAVFTALVVHSLLYAGFFEDPLTWGVMGLAAAVLAVVPEAVTASSATQPSPDTPPVLAH